MPLHRQPRLIPVQEAARTCGRTPGELRRWCAVGRLRCERVAGEWYLLEDDLHLAATIDEMDRTGSDRAIVSMAFRDGTTGQLALDTLRRLFPRRDIRLGIAPLSLDGVELVVVAGSFPADVLPEVVSVAREMGGVVVDGVAEARVGPMRPPDREVDEGQSPYN